MCQLYTILYDYELSRVYCMTTGSWLLERRLSANPGLNFNPGFFFYLSKVISQMIFPIPFRVSNHQIVGKETRTEFAF